MYRYVDSCYLEHQLLLSGNSLDLAIGAIKLASSPSKKKILDIDMNSGYLKILASFFLLFALFISFFLFCSVYLNFNDLEFFFLDNFCY